MKRILRYASAVLFLGVLGWVVWAWNSPAYLSEILRAARPGSWVQDITALRLQRFMVSGAIRDHETRLDLFLSLINARDNSQDSIARFAFQQAELPSAARADLFVAACYKMTSGRPVQATAYLDRAQAIPKDQYYHILRCTDEDIAGYREYHQLPPYQPHAAAAKAAPEQ